MNVVGLQVLLRLVFTAQRTLQWHFVPYAKGIVGNKPMTGESGQLLLGSRVKGYITLQTPL